MSSYETTATLDAHVLMEQTRNFIKAHGLRPVIDVGVTHDIDKFEESRVRRGLSAGGGKAHKLDFELRLGDHVADNRAIMREFKKMMHTLGVQISEDLPLRSNVYSISADTTAGLLSLVGAALEKSPKPQQTWSQAV